MSNTPNPQANKTIDEIEIIERYARGDANPEISVDGGETWWTKPQYRKIKALIAEARTDERQAMLNALPKKQKEMSVKVTKESNDLDKMIWAKKRGWNECCNQMESAIKLMGDNDE